MSDERIMQRHTNQLILKSKELDYYLQSISFGYQTYGGGSAGEVINIALKIKEDETPENWIKEWISLAAAVEKQAKTALEQGHRVSSREAYLSALTYYRTAIFAIRSVDKRLGEVVQKMQSCFHAAAPLFNPPIEPVEFPYQGKTLPGFFMPVARDGNKRPTLIMLGGGEMFAQELYFWAGPAGRERGYNVIGVDMPGQGGTPIDGLYYRPDFEVPMKGVIDWLEKQKEVDRDRIALYGVSFGGYISMRIAAYEKRIKACAASTPIIDWYMWFMETLPEPFTKAPESLDALIQDTSLTDPYLLMAAERMLHFSLGVKTVAEGLKLYRDYRTDVGQITCPVLCMVGDGEAPAFKKQARLAYDQLTSPKEYRRFTVEEGADGHCQAANLRLAHQVLFDWLDDVFKQ